MLPTLLVFFREALQFSLLLTIALACPVIRQRWRYLMAGAVLAPLAGITLVLAPMISAVAPGMEHWIIARQITESAIFYSGLLLLALHGAVGCREEGGAAPRTLVFALGFSLLFFESRTLVLYVEDVTLMEGSTAAYSGALMGIVLGLAPLVFIVRSLPALGLWRFFSPASLMISIGAIKFITGGVGEVDDGQIMISLQQGLQYLVEHVVDHVQSLLLISQHRFMSAPMEGLADYLREDRMSTALTAIFVFAPPVLVMVRVFSRPDPEVADLEVAAERRLRMAYFRRNMVFAAVPVLTSFLLLTVSFHAVNASINPLSDPEPMPVMESDDRPGMIVIPMEDRLGDFTDGKLRKYVYYSADDRIIFLAIMKPDGTVGLALDECEICKPAEWNTSALGYAQRGDHLVCKYCMSPIAIPSVNEPGGCNPIPVIFGVQEGYITLKIEDLVRVRKAARELEKKGTHF